MHVDRSCQLVIRDSVSAPTTSTVWAWPATIEAWATLSAYMKLEHAAETSRHPTVRVPRRFCKRHATFGKTMSGVVVPTTIRSTSAAVIPAAPSASTAAPYARSEVAVSGPAMWRSRIPVCDSIHASVVETEAASSALASTRSGTHRPMPTIVDPLRTRLLPGLDCGESLGERQLRQACHVGPDRVDHARADRFGGQTDGVAHRSGFGTSVAHDADAVDAQQRRAAVLGVVEPQRERFEARARERDAEAHEQTAAQLFAEQAEDAEGETFAELEDDVADEPVAHHDVGGAGKDAAPLDVPDEPQARPAEQLRRPDHEFVALRVLLAVAEQAHPRRFDAEDPRRVDAAHDAELQQMFGPAVHVGAGVQHD